jgi:hypothetical protein
MAADRPEYQRPRSTVGDDETVMGWTRTCRNRSPIWTGIGVCNVSVDRHASPSAPLAGRSQPEQVVVGTLKRELGP